MSRCRITEDTIKPREDGWFKWRLQILLLGSSGHSMEFKLSISWLQSIAVIMEHPQNLIPQVPHQSEGEGESALRDSHTH